MSMHSSSVFGSPGFVEVLTAREGRDASAVATVGSDASWGSVDGATAAGRVVAGAAALLRQGEILLGRISREDYTRRLGVAFGASIGGHYRHCLDHFASLLAACDSDVVDYDRRARDPRLEADPEFALRQTRAMREVFEQWDPESLEGEVGVRCEISYERGDSPSTRSTLGREFVYVIAHGIHHFALIAVMARLQGVALPPDFGVAPSTVAHRGTTSTR